MQARASLLVGAGKGFVAGALADGTLRFGPFGAGFQWFFGGGLFLGPAYLARDSGSDVKMFGGGVAETGFLFGDGDRIDTAGKPTRRVPQRRARAWRSDGSVACVIGVGHDVDVPRALLSICYVGGLCSASR